MDSISIVQFIIKYWLKAYFRSKILTLITTMIILVGAFTSIYLIQKNQFEKEEAKRREVLTYQEQVNQLDQIEKSLLNLTTFIKEQRSQMKETEDLISGLQKERDRLKPLIEADRKLITSVLQYQQEMNQAESVRERWIGFGLGVLASFIASIIWVVLQYLFKKNKVKA